MKNHPNIHIDKVRVIGPCRHKPKGDLMYIFEPTLGFYVPVATATRSVGADIRDDSPIYMKSWDIGSDGIASEILLDFCPPLLHQRHNVFGHDRIGEYVYDAFNWATNNHDIQVDEVDREAWRQGVVRITEVHLTTNFLCPHEEVKAVIDAIDANYQEGKHRDFEWGISLGWAKKRRSKHHILSVYYKWQELVPKFGANPGKIRKLLLALTKDTIRVEVKLFSQGLKYRRLNMVCRWAEEDVAALFFDIFGRYRLPTSMQPALTNHELKVLTKKERNAYLLWLNGLSIKDQFSSRSTVSAYVRQIRKKTGIDVSGWRRPEKAPTIDLRTLFAPENTVGVPDWAIGTRYYTAPSCEI